MFATNATFCFTQHTFFAQMQHEKAEDEAGLCLIILIFGLCPNLFLLLDFNFHEDAADEMFFQNIEKLPWSDLLIYLVHIIAATLLFTSIGILKSFLYLSTIEMH